MISMTDEEALALLDKLLQGQKFKDVQELVFRYSWQGWTYPKIAEQAGYDTGHIRDVGSHLWQQLTEVIGERVTKNSVQAVLRRQAQQQQSTTDQLISAAVSIKSYIRCEVASTNPNFKHLTTNKRQHWGEAIDVSVFYGRSQELTKLKQWILQSHCRLVGLLGMGGIGKTALATKLAEQLQDQFDYLIWQSLSNAPPIEEVLANLSQILSEQQETARSDCEAQVSQVMEYLRSTRCLLILDNTEAILDSSDGLKHNKAQAGQYREGYEGYGEFLRRVGAKRHSN